VRGLKTTYYLRTQSATHVEMSTVNTRQLNAVSSGTDAGKSGALEAAAAAAQAQAAALPATDVKFCAIDDPTCEACQ
jgi:ribonucleoside-diphosphate reductase alpha chain